MSRLRSWLSKRRAEKAVRAHREQVLNRLSTALYPLERDAVRSVFQNLEGFLDLVREGYEGAESPERTAVTLLIAVLPAQLSAIAPADRQAAILATLEEAATGPWQSVSLVIAAPSADPLVTLVRNLASRVRAWAMMGLIDEYESVQLLNEISGAMRGLSSSERVAERLSTTLLDSIRNAATPEFRAVLDSLQGHDARPHERSGT